MPQPDPTAKQHSDAILANELRLKTSPNEADEARKDMEEMSEIYREKGAKLYLPEG